MTAPGPSVLGIGDCTVDIYVDRGVQFPGGNALNVAVLMARRGARASFLGCVGPDALGDLITEAARAEGVDAGRMRRMSVPTCWSRIRHADGDRVFDGSRPQPDGAYALDAADFDWIGGFDHVHSSIYSILDADLPRMRAAMRAGAGGTLSYDFSDEYDEARFAAVLPHIDIAFLSGAERDEAACRSLAVEASARGPSTVVVTRGAAGSLALCDGAFAVAGTTPTEVRDTLGAGDGLIAGFLMARLEGATLADALRVGADAAAEVCRDDGAFGHGMPVADGQPGLLCPDPGNPDLKPPSAAAADIMN